MPDPIKLELQEHPPIRVDVQLRLSRFRLPPVESALAVGRKAPIGANAMTKALDEMLPGAFRRVVLEHDTIEALLIREAHLRRVPEEKLVPLLVRHAEGLMADDEMLHIDVNVEVIAREVLEL